MKAKMLRIFITALVSILVLAIFFVWLTLNWNYSEGERAGYVQKLSSKGWVCKTWEGEIVMVSMPGAIPDRFLFTVSDDHVAKRINTLAGRRVVLLYQQHKFIPSSCFGETEYFVTSVREVSESSSLPVPSAPQGQLLTPR
ncbi:MAG: hypothetical protein Q8O37_14465 [Sulfuricellaceae bacterium]|nr:hypothetical protein [Sulfuricellaceae bacterium]